MPKWARLAARVGRTLGDLLFLVLAIGTILFFLLRLTGDPAIVMAGSDATAEQIAAIRAAHGFDRPLAVQYFAYMGDLLAVDFGRSLISGEPAVQKVLAAAPATLLLTILGMTLTVLIAVPAGAITGLRAARGRGKAAALALFVLQGVPGYVAALILVQLFAIELNWLPAIGFGSVASWILPSLAISLFLAPKLARIVGKHVENAMHADYVRTARAFGAGDARLLWRHALPNALVGAAAVIGAQFAFLVSGVVVIETIFAWPGLGRLLVDATLALDFPVVQAATIAAAILVFAVNVTTDAVIDRLDVRVREARA